MYIAVGVIGFIVLVNLLVIRQFSFLTVNTHHEVVLYYWMSIYMKSYADIYCDLLHRVLDSELLAGKFYNLK